MKRVLLGLTLLALALLLCWKTVAHAAERCFVQVRHHFSEAKKAEWAREAVQQPKRYAREQRYLKIKYLHDLTCEPVGVEMPYTEALLDEDALLVLDLVPVAVQWPLDEDRQEGTETAKGEEFGGFWPEGGGYGSIYGVPTGGVVGWGRGGGGGGTVGNPGDGCGGGDDCGGGPAGPIPPTAQTPELGTLMLSGTGLIMAALVGIKRRMAC